MRGPHGIMQPSKCPSCGGSAFHHDRLNAGPLQFAFTGGHWRFVEVRCSVCLHCGNATTYVDDAGLKSLRARHPGWDRPGEAR